MICAGYSGAPATDFHRLPFPVRLEALAKKPSLTFGKRLDNN
jgi:hypothetical protein